MGEKLYQPLLAREIIGRARSEVRFPEENWYRVFVYADHQGQPINDGGWLVGQIEFRSDDREPIKLAVVNTDHQVTIQTMYDNRLVEFKDKKLTD